MTMIPEQLNEISHQQSIEWNERVAQLPSPSWWASDNTLIRGTGKDCGKVIAKVMSRHAWSWRNRQNMIRAAVAAGEHGIGPRVIAHDEESGVIVTEDLSDTWRVVRLDYYADPQFRANLLEVRRKLAALELDLSPRSPMIELEQLQAECADRNVPVDPRVHVAIATLMEFKAPLLSYRNTVEFHPSQGEATSSNLMVNDEGDVRIVGWGSAAKLSRTHDTALLVSEACPTVLGADALIQEVMPEGTKTDKAVVKVVSLVEHLRWALLMSLRAATDPDEDLDSIKYGLWRMTLAEIALTDTDSLTSLRKELLR